ncbi:MAG: hypothetical protein GY858_09775 [Candidatus Omnitrophica bacterium]|nr:hypothetical protein [Candidatus Omnitrophota bacterium]
MKKIIEKHFGFSLNLNQSKELTRLIFEIAHREKINTKEILRSVLDKKECTAKDKFFAIKKALIKRRFPLSENINTASVFLPDIKKPLKNNWQVQNPFRPIKIFAQENVLHSQLANNFRKAFPSIAIEKIQSYKAYIKTNKLNISEFKKPLIFLTKEKWDFIKPCPCTKGHLSCGYWIFNLGFGCPFDCSYCYLQHYTNFPGIILPANIDDFFSEFNRFSSKLKSTIRIGTGEFCDSLALDHITGYSTKLIQYFANRNVLFELKTKSDNINNLLSITPTDNAVISWSLSPKHFADTEELATATLAQRLSGAQQCQKHGYKIGFHFDPIIHGKNWETLYKKTVEQLYSHVKGPFAWISLGTLRCNRKLKAISEQRFGNSDIFFGELFLGKDKKLRYPEILREEIYAKMLKWIRAHDQKTPVYLCMENKKCWQAVGGGLNSPKKIEKHILGR